MTETGDQYKPDDPEHSVPAEENEFYEDREQLAMDRDTISELEEGVAEQFPTLSAAEVTGVIDESLLTAADSVLHNKHTAQYREKIHELASLITAEGTDEFYGKPTSGENPITVLELADHGDLLDAVLKSYMDAGAFDDATLVANAIDGLTTGEAFETAKAKAHEGFSWAETDTEQEALSLASTALTSHLAFATAPEQGAVDIDKGPFGDPDIFEFPDDDDDGPYTGLGEDTDIEPLAEWEKELLAATEPGSEPISYTKPNHDPSNPLYEWEDYILNGIPQQAVENVITKSKKKKDVHPVHNQIMLEEKEYFADIVVRPAPYNRELSADDIRRRFETDHAVKSAPDFRVQAADETRTNMIVRVANTTQSLKTNTSYSSYERGRVSETEHSVLASLKQYLETAAAAGNVLNEEDRKTAGAMLDKLTFIGEKEYQEAARGIADYWKQSMEANPSLQILPLVGKIGKGYSNEDMSRQIKSDEYLFDAIMGNFSDDELEKYAGRLITEEYRITSEKPEDLKVVLLDDWTISGSQLQQVREEFIEDWPDFEKSVEVQLVAANEKRVKRGLEWWDHDAARPGNIPTPVRAYYLAHGSKYGTSSDAHITGSHSSVDYDAEILWHQMTLRATGSVNELRDDQQVLATMPAAANIVRPYRMPGAQLRNMFRFEVRQARSSAYSVNF